MGNFEYSFKSAHANAQRLMEEDFYWSPIEESGPFGNDDGWEAVTGFFEWRKSNIDLSPIEYLYQLIRGWGYPSFDWNELNPDNIKKFIQSPELTDAEIQIKLQDIKETLKNVPDIQLDNFNDEQLKEMITGMGSNVNLRILLGYDNSIIGTAFAQIASEGTIHSDLKYLASTAIKRQLLPLLINNYIEDYRKIRTSQLEKMLSVIEEIL